MSECQEGSVRKGGGGDGVEPGGVDVTPRRKEKLHGLEEAVGSHHHSSNLVPFISLPVRSAPGSWHSESSIGVWVFTTGSI